MQFSQHSGSLRKWKIHESSAKFRIHTETYTYNKIQNINEQVVEDRDGQ